MFCGDGLIGVGFSRSINLHSTSNFPGECFSSLFMTINVMDGKLLCGSNRHIVMSWCRGACTIAVFNLSVLYYDNEWRRMIIILPSLLDRLADDYVSLMYRWIKLIRPSHARDALGILISRLGHFEFVKLISEICKVRNNPLFKNWHNSK